MVNLIAIIVYDRYDHIQHWLHCWSLCKSDATLVIINNGPKPIDGAINRPNIGFDIGALQDVAMNRLPGFPKYDNLLWITDDVFPMYLDFDEPFWEALKNGAEIACMQISQYVTPHVRTTGFAMSRENIERLKFPADPITTKEQCYAFEHRAAGHLFEQFKAVQVATDESSPLFDTGYHRRLKYRWQEHVKVFGEVGQEAPTTPLISIICPAYNSFPYIISSLLAQTYTNWELHLVHDGPNDTGLGEQVAAFNDKRIIYTETVGRSKNWGHSIRSEWIQKVTGDYIVVTNQDNFYSPVFFQKAIDQFNKRPMSVAVYCEQIVHNYTDYKVMNCRVARGYIDCGQVMIKRKQAAEVGWRDIFSHSSDWFFFRDIVNTYGIACFSSFPGCHFFHC